MSGPSRSGGSSTSRSRNSPLYLSLTVVPPEVLPVLPGRERRQLTAAAAADTPVTVELRHKTDPPISRAAVAGRWTVPHNGHRTSERTDRPTSDPYISRHRQCTAYAGL